MSRLLRCGNARKVSEILLRNRNLSISEADTVSSLSRLMGYNKPFLRGYSLGKARNALLTKHEFWKCGNLSARNLVSHSAQISWKRIFHLCSYGGSVLPPISRIACAVTLALTRSNLVAPGVIAFIAGEFALREQRWSNAEHIPKMSTLYHQSLDGKLYFTAFLFSILEIVTLFIRAIYLAVLFSPCIAMVPFVNSMGAWYRETWVHLVHRTLENAGPAFIKWGQWAATRPDLFAKDLCRELSKLQTNAPSHSFSFSKKSIEKAFGRKLPEIFESFQEEPIASGSVAQVHQATLKYKYPSQEIKPIVVAVKVRHPGVAEAIRRDFEIINFMVKIAKFIPSLKGLRLEESVQQFSVFMMSQVDLSREAAHLNRFIYNFRSWKDVSFPKPLYPFVHPSVLVETFEQGESIMHYVDDLNGHEKIKSDLAHIGSHALLKMLLVDNFIHADMHPGNILVRVSDSNSSRDRLFKSRPHVVFLDVGMTAELSKRDRGNLVEFFKAVTLRDGRTAAECTLRLSKKQNCPNPKAFVQEVENSFKFWSTPQGEVVSPGDCIKQLLEQVRRHKVNIDGNVCTVMVTTLVLEGWQHKLDPEYNVMDTMKTLLFKAEWAESFFYTIEGLMAP